MVGIGYIVGNLFNNVEETADKLVCNACCGRGQPGIQGNSWWRGSRTQIVIRNLLYAGHFIQ